MKNKRNIFSEWINKIRNRNRVNEGIYYVSQRLRRTAKVVIPELNGLQDSINGVNDRLQTLDNNAAKKNTTNTFTQKQTFRNEVEFGTNIKMGYGAGVVNLTPEDDSSKTLSIQRFDINMNNKKISNLANPTANNDAANKVYVDSAIANINLTNITNEINSIKQKNTEQDSEINAIKNINTTQSNEINSIKQKNTEQDTEINAIKQKNTQQDSSISGIDSRVRTLENRPQTDISGLTQRVSTNETNIRTNASNLNSYKNNPQWDGTPNSANSLTPFKYAGIRYSGKSLSGYKTGEFRLGGIDFERFRINFPGYRYAFVSCAISPFHDNTCVVGWDSYYETNPSQTALELIVAKNANAPSNSNKRIRYGYILQPTNTPVYLNFKDNGGEQ